MNTSGDQQMTYSPSDEESPPHNPRQKQRLNDFQHKEERGVYSSNLRTLRTTDPRQDGVDFMKQYFSNLVGMKEGLKKMYFDKSSLTFNQKQYFGIDPILMNLSQLRGCPFYNIHFISAQPTLGNGIFITVNGNCPDKLFLMNIVIINIKKKYRILNQFIELSPVLTPFGQATVPPFGQAPDICKSYTGGFIEGLDDTMNL